MEKSLTLEFKYTEKEYSEAVKWYYAKLFNIKIDIVVSIICIVLGVAFLITGNDSFLNKVFILLGFILLLMMLFVLYVNPRRIFRQEPKFQDVYNLGFNDEGISFKTEHINSTIAWSHYSQIKENKDFFYLVYGKYMFSIIPKRAFFREEDEVLFRNLIKEKIEGLKQK